MTKLNAQKPSESSDYIAQKDNAPCHASKWNQRYHGNQLGRFG